MEEALTVAVHQENDCLFARHAAGGVLSPPTPSAVSARLLRWALCVRRNPSVEAAVRSATSSVSALDEFAPRCFKRVSEGILYNARHYTLIFFGESRSVG